MVGLPGLRASSLPAGCNSGLPAQAQSGSPCRSRRASDVDCATGSLDPVAQLDRTRGGRNRRGMELTPVLTFPASGYARVGAHGRHKYMLTVRTRASDKTTLVPVHILADQFVA